MEYAAAARRSRIREGSIWETISEILNKLLSEPFGVAHIVSPSFSSDPDSRVCMFSIDPVETLLLRLKTLIFLLCKAHLSTSAGYVRRVAGPKHN
jgi:hypothetical protein